MTVQSHPETTIPSARTASLLSADARSVLISMNPKAGARSRHEHVAKIAAALSQAGFRSQTTTDLSELRGLAQAGLKSGNLRVVLSVGGDGTASIVRNHVPLEVPLLVVPMGTENLLGRYLSQETTITAVCDVIQNGVVADFDLGRAGDKYFLLMVSAGFDAEVIRSLHENRRGNISHASYVLPALRTILSYHYPKMRIYWDATEASAGDATPYRWLFGFNFPLYALGLPIAPQAVATDGQVDVCTFERGAAWSVARYLWHIVRRMHLTLPDAALRQTPRFRLEPVDSAAIPFQLDGDYAGELPVEIDILPGQLRLLISQTTAERLGFALPGK